MQERHLSTADYVIVRGQVHITEGDESPEGRLRTFCGLGFFQSEGRAQRGWCPICDDEARRLSGTRHDLVIDR